MTDPRRLIDSSSSPWTQQLLDAGRSEEPSAELVARCLQAAVLGVAAAGAVQPAAAAAGTQLAAAPTALSAAAAAAVPSAASAAAAASGAAAVSGAGALPGAAVGGAGLTKGGVIGSVLVKWVGIGVVGVATAVGAPPVIRQLEGAAGESTPLARGGTPRVDVQAPAPAVVAAHGPETSTPPDVVPAPRARTPSEAAPSEASRPRVRQRGGASAVARSRAEPHGRGEPHALSAELASVERARSALAAGDPERVLRELADHEARFPRRQLELEVSVLRMEAYVSLGAGESARALARHILASPVSRTHAARAREVLQKQGPR